MQSPAGFWNRFFASLLDGIIIGIPLLIISYLITGSMDETPITFIGDFLYSLLIPVIWSGFTVGKKLVGIRIIKIDGSDVSFGTMLIRVLSIYIIYGLTLGIALIVSAFMVGLRDDKRAIHDFIAGTCVTNLPKYPRS